MLIQRIKWAYHTWNIYSARLRFSPRPASITISHCDRRIDFAWSFSFSQRGLICVWLFMVEYPSASPLFPVSVCNSTFSPRLEFVSSGFNAPETKTATFFSAPSLAVRSVTASSFVLFFRRGLFLEFDVFVPMSQCYPLAQGAFILLSSEFLRQLLAYFQSILIKRRSSASHCALNRK